MTIKRMKISDYRAVYSLWVSTPSMGLNTAVDCAYRHKGIGTALVNTALEALRKEGITKAAFVVFRKNELGNAFWERLGFQAREDLIYRNKIITDIELRRIDP